MEQPAAKALIELATSDSGRTIAGRVREIWPAIQAAKAAGVTDQKIVETLKSQGLDVQLQTFRSIISRLRKEQQSAAPIRRPISPVQPTQQVVSKPATVAKNATGGQRPAGFNYEGSPADPDTLI